MQHKIFCVREFIKTESATAVQREFRLCFKFQPPTRKSIWRWNHQFEQIFAQIGDWVHVFDSRCISSQHSVLLPICVKVFPLQYNLVATLFIYIVCVCVCVCVCVYIYIYIYIYIQSLRCHICVHIYILHNIKTMVRQEKNGRTAVNEGNLFTCHFGHACYRSESPSSSEWSIDSQAVLSVESFAATEFNKIFFVQTAAPGCEGFQTFRQVTDSSRNVCYLPEESLIESRRCLLGIWRLVNG